MRILVIGSGGREHALAWKIAQSPLVAQIYCAPGNPGMAGHAKCVDIASGDIDGLLKFAADRKIDLTVVGPEDPLAAGIVDRFAEAGLRAFGPSAAAARLESSKAFAKAHMARHGIPTAAYAEFANADDAIEYVKSQPLPIVIKADGLAAGKGVTVAQDIETAIRAIRESLDEGAFGDAGNRLIVEEFLDGEEASFFSLTDGHTIVSLASGQDHKRAFDGDTGPNTGGMGAYSPAPVVTPEVHRAIEEQIVRPCIEGMARDGHPYRGVLYTGVMVTASGPRVVEFNCRFGDPETQVVLPRMKSDLVPLLLACCDGTLDRHRVEWHGGACVTVVMASGGYPKAYAKGMEITGIDAAERVAGVQVFHAGTAMKGGRLVSNGGRVLAVTAMGSGVASAVESAYAAVSHIRFDGAFHRNDIAHRALGRRNGCP